MTGETPTTWCVTAAITPGWRKEPPTLDEVHICPWWWARDLTDRPPIPQVLCLAAIGDRIHVWETGRPLAPAEWGGADAEWAPCLPPGTDTGRAPQEGGKPLHSEEDE